MSHGLYSTLHKTRWKSLVEPTMPKCKRTHELGFNEFQPNLKRIETREQSTTVSLLNATKPTNAFHAISDHNNMSRPCCQGPHKIYGCEKFSRLEPTAKLKFPRDSKLCLCLSSGHFKYRCNSSSSYRICRQSHHTLLHRTTAATTVTNPAKKVQQTSYNYAAAATTSVNNATSSLFDCGSHASFMAESCVRRLGLRRKPSTAIISGISSSQGGQARGSKGIGSRFDEQRLMLRIHRGRCSNQNDSTHSNGSTQSTITSMGTPSPERLSKYTTRRQPYHDKIKISISYASSENINVLANSESACSHDPLPFSSSSMLYAVHFNSANGRYTNESHLYPHQGSCNSYPQVGRSMPEIGQRQSHINDLVTNTAHQQRNNKKIMRRNLITQVKRFRMETKAAKTLAIIVGLFIFCWLPFFTIYVIRAFCEDCIDPLLFSILFWLGYCNSAVNPMIYALFSKDFRFAFKVIICHCSCAQERISLKNSRRDSDISAGRYRERAPSITTSAAAHSLGHESEVRERSPSITPSAIAQSLDSYNEIYHSEVRRDIR